MYRAVTMAHKEINVLLTALIEHQRLTKVVQNTGVNPEFLSDSSLSRSLVCLPSEEICRYRRAPPSRITLTGSRQLLEQQLAWRLEQKDVNNPKVRMNLEDLITSDRAYDMVTIVHTVDDHA